MEHIPEGFSTLQADAPGKEGAAMGSQSGNPGHLGKM